MKLSNWSKFVGAAILSASLVSVPFSMSASAQDSTTTGTDTNTTSVDRNAGTADNYEDNSFDWGWLGLLGLLGLAGLSGRKREEPARYREPDEVTRPGSRY